jgi:DNA-binding NarL/FixJ family response regulator
VRGTETHSARAMGTGSRPLTEKLASFTTAVSMTTETVFDTISVFLLVENRLVRDALTKVLNKKNGIQVLATSAFSPQALQQIIDQAPNVLLLDSAAVEFCDVQGIRAARRELPDLKVMLIGMEADKDIFLRAVRAGVVGYVLKDAHASEIAAAVRCVAANNAVCPPGLCLALFEAVARQPVHLPVFHSKRKFGLSRREQQLLERVSCGLTNKEIANQLNLSEQTVKNHIHRILQTLGVEDRLSAVESWRSCLLDSHDSQRVIS